MGEQDDVVARARTEFEAIKYLIAERRPYFSSAVFSLCPVYTSKTRTLAVDPSWRIYINPDYFVKHNPEEQLGVVVHEISHLIREHAERGESIGASHRLWNAAGDLEINSDIVKDGLSLPNGALLPSRFHLEDGKAAEEYYHHLPQSALSNQSNGQQNSSDQQEDSSEQQGDQIGSGQQEDSSEQQGDQIGSGQQEDSAEQQRDQSGSDQQEDSAEQQGDQIGSGQQEDSAEQQGDQSGSGQQGESQDWQCGSGAGGEPGPWEIDPQDPNYPGLSKGEADLKRRQVARDILDYEKAKGRGSVPTGLSMWAKNLVQPTVPWPTVLRSALYRTLSTAGQFDYTMSRPNRRFATAPVILPSLRAPKLKVGVVIDTSGSMLSGSQQVSDLDVAMSEVAGILRKTQADVVLIPCDAEAYKAQQVFWGKHVENIELRGGGGTDMSKGLEAAGKIRDLNAIVVLTDGDTPWPDRKPKNIPVIVATTGRSGPAWARTVYIGNDRESAAQQQAACLTEPQMLYAVPQMQDPASPDPGTAIPSF